MRFSDMLDRKAEEIKAPPLLPPGTYEVFCKSFPDQDEHTAKGVLYDRLTFSLSVVAPINVDEDELKEYGKVEGAPIKEAFYFTTVADEDRSREMTLNNLKAFLTALGAFEEGMTLQEGLAAAPGKSCYVDIGHRQDKENRDRFYLETQRYYSEIE